MVNRRKLLSGLTGIAAAALLPRRPVNATDPASSLHISTNTFPWSTFARREGKTLKLHTDRLLGDIASTGIAGYEPIINEPSEFEGLKARLAKHGLEMRSLYVNSVLHDDTKSSASIDRVLRIAEQAGDIGTTIIVTNPSPIRWGGSEDKSDQQLRHQAKSLNRLGESLRNFGITLAYHNHDSELRQGAREFHHMLTATSPDHVKFCLDAHWVYRGCGNSQVALFDAVEHYASRVVELHLRQSRGGVWTETFTSEGDIDYGRLFDVILNRGIQPHLVLEQAVEADSPSTIDVVTAHQTSNMNLKNTLT